VNLRNFTEQHVKEMLNISSEKDNNDHQVKKAQFSRLERGQIIATKEDISILNDVELQLEVELGNTQINLREVINLFEGQVITLNRIAGDTVDLKANKQWLAHGEVLVLNEVLGIRINSFNKEEENTAKGVK
jgi:flagellar motor switch protein FliN/FliY